MNNDMLDLLHRNDSDNYKLIYKRGFEYVRVCDMCKSEIPYDAKICRYCNSFQDPVLTPIDLNNYEYRRNRVKEETKQRSSVVLVGIISLILGFGMLFSGSDLVFLGILSICFGVMFLYASSISKK